MYCVSVCAHTHTPVYERERHSHCNNHNLRKRRIGTKGTYLTMNPFLLNIVDYLLDSFGKVQKIPAQT